MISICLKKNKVRFLIVVGLLVGLVIPHVVTAQTDNSLSFSVTPTLFEMAAAPEQAWKSNVKVINNNRYPITVYANAVNFAPQGEAGQGKFVPVFSEMTEGTTLAEWIEISSEPILLEPGESKAVPFTVQVPKDANPGGHFAAILIGTRPPENDGPFKVKTSQIVTSLFFLRIAGDVIEDGSIREFTTIKSFLNEPVVDFNVRFENNGNVHIQPQGQIVITNMWGKERGVIPINHKTHFGNVLPESIRKFEFTWKGESQFTDIGRYTAELALAFGTDNRKFVTSTAHFWVVPIKPVLTVLGIFFGSIIFVLWAVKAYVRRMLALEGYQPIIRQSTNGFRREGDVLITRRQKFEAPVRAGWADLWSRLKHTTAFVDTAKALWSFGWQYRLFFGGIIVSVVLIALAAYFIKSVFTDSRDYEVIINNPDSDVTISSEEILYEQQKEQENSQPALSTEANISEQPFTLTIVNSSDNTGVAAAVGQILESEYEITGLKSDFNESKERSVIVYHKDLQAEALEIRDQLGDFILSALPPDTAEQSITIYIGNDYRSE